MIIEYVKLGAGWKLSGKDWHKNWQGQWSGKKTFTQKNFAENPFVKNREAPFKREEDG